MVAASIRGCVHVFRSHVKSCWKEKRCQTKIQLQNSSLVLGVIAGRGVKGQLEDIQLEAQNLHKVWPCFGRHGFSMVFMLQWELTAGRTHQGWSFRQLSGSSSLDISIKGIDGMRDQTACQEKPNDLHKRKLRMRWNQSNFLKIHSDYSFNRTILHII